MDDIISRQAALVTVKDALMAWSYMPEWRDEKIIEAIAEMPSAQPEPKRGTWIKYPSDSELYICSECASFWGSKDKFCRFCGADMREVTT